MLRNLEKTKIGIAKGKAIPIPYGKASLLPFIEIQDCQMSKLVVCTEFVINGINKFECISG
jgi:hypothetical protein